MEFPLSTAPSPEINSLTWRGRPKFPVSMPRRQHFPPLGPLTVLHGRNYAPRQQAEIPGAQKARSVQEAPHFKETGQTKE